MTEQNDGSAMKLPSRSNNGRWKINDHQETGSGGKGGLTGVFGTQGGRSEEPGEASG
jgi:hypothetical protein